MKNETTNTATGIHCPIKTSIERSHFIHSPEKYAELIEKDNTDLELSLYKQQVVELKEKVKKLEFMIENGLGWEDMRNDI